MTNPIDMAKTAGAPLHGETPVFKTPWEARIFALTAHLTETNQFVWDDFRDALVHEISASDVRENNCDNDIGTPYYRAWLTATEKLLSNLDYCSTGELDQRIETLRDPHGPGKLSPTGTTARPVGESHSHD
jgi:nitrile hydratase accessory protein